MPTPVVLLVAVIVPVMTVVALWRLFVGLWDLEQTADELVELRQRGPGMRKHERRTT
jgi:hypothetical protein